MEGNVIRLQHPRGWILLFWAIKLHILGKCLDVNGKKVRVTWKIFGNLMENAKASYSSW
jgi:hypothetical protein